VRAGLADALLKQGARQDAVAAAMEVLPALEGGVTSMRCLNRLRVVRQAAGGTAGAQEFCERFDAVERILTVSYGMAYEDTPDARADIPALWHEIGYHAASARKLMRMELRTWRRLGGERATPGMAENWLVTGLTAVGAVLDATDEYGPCLRLDGEAGTVRVL